MNARLGVAVIGLGVGAQHAAAFARLPQCDVRWLCDIDEARAETLAAALPPARPTANETEILQDARVDIVSIASYDDAHFRQAMAFVGSGKHAFIEKPLCRSLDELRGLRATWSRAGRPHVRCNLVLRAAPLYRHLRELIAAGALGEIYAIDGDYLYGRLHKILEGWRSITDEYSVMQGGGVHLVDLMMWLTGQRPRAVAAVGNRICTSGTVFRYDDFVSAVFTFDSGLVGRITANFGCVHKHQHVLRVYGTRGTFVYDDMGARLHTERDPGAPPERLSMPALPASKGDLIPSFVSAIVEHAAADEPFQVEMDVMSACVAADHARTTGHTEEIEYV